MNENPNELVRIKITFSLSFKYCPNSSITPPP